MLFGLIKKRILIYTAFGNEKYFQIAGKLSAAGIRFTTKSSGAYSQYGGSARLMNTHNDKNTQYDFYVLEKDVHQARQAINS